MKNAHVSQEVRRPAERFLVRISSFSSKKVPASKRGFHFRLGEIRPFHCRSRFRGRNDFLKTQDKL